MMPRKVLKILRHKQNWCFIEKLDSEFREAKLGTLMPNNSLKVSKW